MVKNTVAKPFLKWAGGKGQLLAQLDAHVSDRLKQRQITRYIEPFVGAGAMFFYVAQHYPVTNYILNDINPALIQTYQTLKYACEPLITELARIAEHYYRLPPAAQAEYYYQQRHALNQGLNLATGCFNPAWLPHAAQLIFLNKTGFNGLYRVNRQGLYNVPHGRYTRPTICPADLLRSVSIALQNVTLTCQPYESCSNWIDSKTFVYLDPPYRPLNPTARFTQYAQQGFTDADQMALARFYRQQAAKGADLMLSNADPQHADPDDHFFLDAYQGFAINRIYAGRAINSQGQKRGAIPELVITNYTRSGI